MCSLDQLITNGFIIEIQPGVIVRLTSPDKQVNIGRADTLEDALLEALQNMVIKLEAYRARF